MSNVVNNSFVPGRLRKLNAVLTNYDGSNKIDITQLIVQISITEDIFKPTLYGAMHIRDAVDLMGKFMILGEEFIELTYLADWKAEPVEIKLRFAVYKISNLEYNQNNTLKEYTLHFCSEEQLISSTSVVMKSYNSEHHNNVQNLAKDYLKIDKQNEPFVGKRIKKFNYIEPTRGKQTVCIPRLSPLEALDFISRRSIGETLSSGTYLFFETFKGFNFCDIEYLISKGMEKAKPKNSRDKTEVNIDYYYSIENPLIEESISPVHQAQIALKVVHRNFFDTIEKLRRGLFESNVLIYDYINKRTMNHRFRFLDNDDSTNSKSLVLGGVDGKSYPENSITFMQNNTTLNSQTEPKFSRQFFIPKDYSQLNNDTFLDQIYPSRASYFTRLAQNMYTLDVYGNPLINAGDVIYLKVPQGNPDPNSDSNQFTEGYYLICTINHILTQTTYQAKYDVYRSGFSGQVRNTSQDELIRTTPNDNTIIPIETPRTSNADLGIYPEDNKPINNFFSKYSAGKIGTGGYIP